MKIDWFTVGVGLLVALFVLAYCLVFGLGHVLR
jgi:hypothetical protein